MLTEFTVVQEAGDLRARGTLVHCRDGLGLVLAVVADAALDKYFRKTGLTTAQRTRLVETNLKPISEIISAKYAAGESSTYERNGRAYPLVTVKYADLLTHGVKLETAA
jgi:hypothetical protein